jgi:hypothetical protein
VTICQARLIWPKYKLSVTANLRARLLQRWPGHTDCCQGAARWLLLLLLQRRRGSRHARLLHARLLLERRRPGLLPLLLLLLLLGWGRLLGRRLHAGRRRGARCRRRLPGHLLLLLLLWRRLGRRLLLWRHAVGRLRARLQDAGLWQWMLELLRGRHNRVCSAAVRPPSVAEEHGRHGDVGVCWQPKALQIYTQADLQGGRRLRLPLLLQLRHDLPRVRLLLRGAVLQHVLQLLLLAARTDESLAWPCSRCCAWRASITTHMHARHCLGGSMHRRIGAQCQLPVCSRQLSMWSCRGTDFAGSKCDSTEAAVLAPQAVLRLGFFVSGTQTGRITDLAAQPELRDDLVALRLGDGLAVGRAVRGQDPLQVRGRHAALLALGRLLLLRRRLLHGAGHGGPACCGNKSRRHQHQAGCKAGAVVRSLQGGARALLQGCGAAHSTGPSPRFAHT